MSDATDEDDREEAQEFESLTTEIDRRIKRLKDAAIVDAKAEFVSNLYPLLKNLVRATDQRLLATEEQVIAMAEEADSVLQYEDGAYLAGLITTGLALVTAFEEGRPPEEVAALAEQFKTAAPDALNLIQDITVGEPEPDGVAPSAEEQQ